ncbi:hypothetical protein GCM10011375_16960 [Hymenobacter qilianensis]|nr:hypothetical protein GCM10011375_16960 [Hymenobacter qilianensis]
MLKPSLLAKWGVAALLLSSLSSCEDILEQYFPKPNPTPPPTFPSLGLDIPFYVLSGGTQLDAYSTKDAATRTASVAITGLQGGERILAIDFRPATGQLYGLGSNSRLYVINQITGSARVIGTQAFSPAVVGGIAGFDFNPTVDRIRVVSSTGQNLRLNPETGAVDATDGAINGASNGAILTGVAYTNNTNGVSTTALYAINSLDKQLYLVNPPNNGTVAPVGALNLNIAGDGGFDIDAKSGAALGLYAVNGQPTLFTVDLTTGTARPLAQYSASLGYTGLAIRTQPIAYATANVCSASGCPQQLLIFNPTDPTTFINKPITGLLNQEILEGLDFRPSTGQLYAFGRINNWLYTINPATGAATFIARLSTNLLGGAAGFDFDPLIDAIRMVNTNRDNLRVNPVTGAVTRDIPSSVIPTYIIAAAYDNNFTGTNATNLYVVDYLTDRLYQQNPPNTGRLTDIGRLGIDVGGDTHLDIGGLSNTTYLMHTPSGVFNVSRPGPSGLYTIKLSTGVATSVGDYDFLRALGDYQLGGFTIGLGF